MLAVTPEEEAHYERFIAFTSALSVGLTGCARWLKDRKGRALSAEEIEHYQRVVVALNAKIRIMGAIDAAIEEHDGWPIQ